MEDSEHSPRFIVVGIDGSEESKEALRWAARQSELTGAGLRAVTCWHVPAMAYGSGLLPPVDMDLKTASEELLQRTLKEVLDGVAVTSIVVEGYPAPALLEAAAGAELLVVGSRGHGAFAGMLLGSVSDHCVAHATCPVVVVHHQPPSK